MSIEKINFSYPKGTLQSVFDTESMTALELASKTSKKVDECVELVNGVEQSAIEATAVVEEMRTQQQEFITDNNDTRSELLAQNQTLLDGLEASNTTFQNEVTASKNTFETTMNASLTSFQNNLNTSKTTFETNMNSSLTSFQNSLNTSKATFETNMSTAVNNIVNNSNQIIENDVNDKIQDLITDGTIQGLINTNILNDVKADITQLETNVSTFQGEITDLVNDLDTHLQTIDNSGVNFDQYGFVVEGENHRISSGSLGPNGGGFLVGGAPETGGDGMWLSMDSNPAWATMMSSLLGSKSEVTIQPNSINGVVNTNGVNVYWVSGSKFDPNWIGKRIYINNVLYTISLINSSTTLTLTTSAGTQNNVAYQKVAVLYKSVVNTNETIVTWVSGMLFPYWWVGQTVSINGTNYTVNSVSTDGKTLTLTTTAGIKTNASLFKEESNLDCANIGINKQSGTNEERLVIVAKATGEYRIATVATGIGKHYPLFFDVGGQNAMSIDTNRNVTISNSGNAQLNISGALGGGRNYYHISKTTGEYVIYNDVSGDIFIIDVSGRVNFKKPPVLPTYNKASLPVATAVGSMIYVNDDIGGAVVAFADGSVWRRVTDRAVIA